MRKIFTLCLLLLCLHANGSAQTLTREQMLEDYNQLYTTLTTNVPHFGVRRRATGMNIPRRLERLKQGIDTVSCDGGFYEILNRALALCNDMHISVDGSCRDSAALARTYNAYMKHNPFLPNKAKGVIYIDGKYYTPGYGNKQGEAIPYLSELTHINGIPVDKYVAKHNSWVCSATRWDFKHHKAWATELHDPRKVLGDDKFTWTVLIDGKSKKVDMTNLGYIYLRDYFDDNVFRVNYFERDNTLYIRIPEMRLSKADWIENEITKHIGKPLKRVIIDVRGNGGGNDFTWRRTLEAIIDKPLHIPLRQAVKNLDVLSSQDYKGVRDIDVYGDKLKTFIDSDSETYLYPSERSLNYSGKIYIMVDQNIFSSTLGLLSACQRSESLVSIGTPSGYLGGIGGTPQTDILPHSRFAYRYPITLEITEADQRKPESYYKDEVDVVIWPTLEQKMVQLKYNKPQHAEEFLYNHDWVFRKILEIDN